MTESPYCQDATSQRPDSSGARVTIAPLPAAPCWDRKNSNERRPSASLRDCPYATPEK